MCANDRLQDIKLDKLGVQVNESYKKDEKQTKHFEPSKDEDVLKKN